MNASQIFPGLGTDFCIRQDTSVTSNMSSFRGDTRVTTRCLAVRVFAVVLFLACVTNQLCAQATDARITGLVTDPSKAVIREVQVVATNNATGVRYPTTTNASGIFVLEGLPIGQYRIELEHQGFKSIVMPGVILHVQDVAEINFEMAVGSASETVTVNGNSVNVNTTDGTISTVIDHTFIENMPLNGNDLTTLFELTPGTLLNAGGTPSVGGGFSVDGQRPTANYLTIDGANADAYIPSVTGSSSNNTTGASIATSASGGTNGILPVDAIEEYRMDTSTYTAENGRTPGGQIQVRTRSGTNEFHGTLFEDFRNQVMDAVDWFTKYDNLTQSQLRMNEFGGTLGGPVIIPHIFDGRNRLFFFVANDNLVLDQPNTNTESDVPDASFGVDAYPAFLPWLSIFPPGNGGQIPGLPSFDYFNASYPDLIRDHTTSVRGDWQLPRSIHAFFRANLAPSSSVEPSVVGEAVDGDGSHISVNTYTGGVVIPINSRMVDELTVNATRNNTEFLRYIPSLDGNKPDALEDNLPSGVNASTDAFEFVPIIIGSQGVAYSEATVGPGNRNALHQWNVVDTFALHQGKHTLKCGIDYLSKQSMLRFAGNVFDAYVEGAAVPPDTSTGIDTGTLVELITQTYNPYPTVSLSNMSLFANDDWKVTPPLSLNAGVRWEFNPAPTVGPLGAVAVVGDNLNPGTFQDALSTASLYQDVYSNFAPRLGFAWMPLAGSGTTVRGGAGIYFDTGQAATVAGTNAAQGYPYVDTQTLTNVSYASFNWASPGGTAVGVATSPVYLVDPHLLSPRTYEWSLTVEQAFGKFAELTTSYVGNDGERLIGQDAYYNGEDSAGLYPVNTTYVLPYGYLYVTTNQSHSNYQALQTQFTSRVGQKCDVLASYTWGHAEDNGSTDFSSVGAAALNPIANSANDIRQMFAAAIHYAPQGLKANRFLGAVTGGWGLDTIARLQTASPITATFSNFAANNVNNFTSNADVISGVPTVLHEHIDNYSGKDVPGNILLNWAAFTAPPTNSSGVQLRNGGSPTNGYRLFGLKQWDLAASRTWSIWEGLNLNFRVDAYNILNTANFASSGIGSWTSNNSSSFGQAVGTYAGIYGESTAGNGQTGAQLSVFQNGGPRELQLSLKLKF
jgi:hypothetical protein